MKGSPGATSSARGRGWGRREGEGRRASSFSPEATVSGRHPPPQRAPGGLASAFGSPATAGESPRKADFSRKERKLPGSGIMGRGLAPSPTTTGIRGESSAEGKEAAPACASAWGWGSPSRDPRAQPPPNSRLPTMGEPGSRLPRTRVGVPGVSNFPSGRGLASAQRSCRGSR